MSKRRVFSAELKLKTLERMRAGSPTQTDQLWVGRIAE